MARASSWSSPANHCHLGRNLQLSYIPIHNMDITEKETIHKVLLNHLSIIFGIYNAGKLVCKKWLYIKVLLPNFCTPIFEERRP